MFLQKVVIALKKGMTIFFLEEEHERWIVGAMRGPGSPWP